MKALHHADDLHSLFAAGAKEHESRTHLIALIVVVGLQAAAAEQIAA
jgi:hypothetical protein